MTPTDRPADIIAKLRALTAAIDAPAAAASDASTRDRLERQLPTPVLLEVERLYTRRYGMRRGIPYVQYLRRCVRLVEEHGEGALQLLERDLAQAQANDEPGEWAF